MLAARSAMLSCPSAQPSCHCLTRHAVARVLWGGSSETVKGSAFLARSSSLQRQRQQHQLAVRRPLAPRAAAAPVLRAVAAPLAQVTPGVLRVAGRMAARLAARLFSSGVLLNLARGARGAFAGRVGPVLIAFLTAYSVAVTLYAAKASAAAGASAGSSSLASTDPQPPAAETPESPAAAVAASVLSPPPPSKGLERKLQQVKAAAASKAAAAAASKKEESRKVCKVCGGSGKVDYENHMTEYDGTLCPCCLGKGSVKSGKGDLISCLLSFDP